MTSRTVLELFVQQDDELTDTAIMNCSPGEGLCGCAEAVLATCCRVLQTPQKHATLGYLNDSHRTPCENSPSLPRCSS